MFGNYKVADVGLLPGQMLAGDRQFAVIDTFLSVPDPASELGFESKLVHNDQDRGRAHWEQLDDHG